MEADRSHYKNDAMLNNRNFNNISRKKQIDCALIRESLSEHSTQLIINMAHHLKAERTFDELKLCCEELVNREPMNVGFHVGKFNTFFKLRDKDGAKDEF